MSKQSPCVKPEDPNQRLSLSGGWRYSGLVLLLAAAVLVAVLVNVNVQYNCYFESFVVASSVME